MKVFIAVVFGILLMVVGGPQPIWALESVDLYGGLQWIGSPAYTPAAASGTPTGGPSPLLNAYSIGFPFVIGRLFRFEPEVTLFGTQYGLVPGYEKTVPVEREYAHAVWFLDALIELSLWLDVPLNDRLSLGATLGAGFLGRIPVLAWGEGWDQLGEMASYLYGQARYLYPAFGLFVSFRPASSERLEVVLRGKTYFPVFHFWDNEEVGVLDQFMVNVSIGLRIFPGSKRDSPAGSS